ncbi:NDP-glycosyltransferase YjiC-like [Oppia nitens]|uniref:NDP-glycosyltransferase YjiC-like n=1 Tax=Oppia nitens TaxID=1686743 RepID=UPI0023DCCC94|nr:NDP-glycosyltransferase YjiC-like [Oppia nitens]
MITLFISLDAVGHVNSCIGIAQQLVGAGHDVYFLISRQFRGQLQPHGIHELYYEFGDTDAVESDDNDDETIDDNPAKRWAQVLADEGHFDDLSTLDKMIIIRSKRYESFCSDAQQLDPIIESTIVDIGPDIIVVDHLLSLPAVEVSGVPWVWSCSCNPLFLIDDDRTPPFGSGYSIYGDKNEYQLFRQTINDAGSDVWQQFNDYCVDKGCEPLPDYQYIRLSPFLNIYAFPIELDYTDIRPLPPNVYQFDNFMRNDKLEIFELPEQLQDKPGKLIYFSLGTMGAMDVQNMKRLIAILSNVEHRFIVSKGPLHNEYDLPDNMWGQQSVPQLQVLPLVDLVITHGGNNTVGETMFFGKPMILMPLFADQSDNAQCVEDRGFGVRLNLHNCTEQEILSAIDKLLADNQLHEKLANIAQHFRYSIE